MITKQLTDLIYKTQPTSSKQLQLASQELFQHQANTESNQTTNSHIH